MRFIVIFFMVLWLEARENPFQAVISSGDTGKTTHIKEKMKSFSSTSVNLPSTARILKDIEFHFQNLDGSVESKKVKIEKKVDWHERLVIKKLNDTTTLSIKPKIKSEPKKIELINFLNIVGFSIDGKSLLIKTKDRKIRDFLVTNPSKIVVDFQRELSFYTKVYALKTEYFSSITIGKHSGYYRVAIELDGKYLYEKQRVKDGYVFRLK